MGIRTKSLRDGLAAAPAIAAASLALSFGTALAQRVPVDASPATIFNPQSRRCLVRAASGTLYSVTCRPSGQLRLRRKGAQDRRFTTLDLEIAEASSGVSDKFRSNGCSMAIDSKGVLHVVWARYHYPKHFEQFYRRVHPESGAMSEIVRSSHFGGKPCGRSVAMSVAVDRDDRVYIAAPSSGFWRTRLLCVEPAEVDADVSMRDLGTISHSGCSQHVSVAVDRAGVVHCAYYGTHNGGTLRHTTYRPAHAATEKAAAGWPRDGKRRTHGDQIAKSPFRSVFSPMLSCDTAGGVHLSYVSRTDRVRCSIYYTHRAHGSDSWTTPLAITEETMPAVADPNFYYSMATRDDGSRAYFAVRNFEPRKSPALGRKRGAIRVFQATRTANQVASFEHASDKPLLFYKLQTRYALFPQSMRLHGSFDVGYVLRNADGAERFRVWRWPTRGAQSK